MPVVYQVANRTDDVIVVVLLCLANETVSLKVERAWWMEVYMIQQLHIHRLCLWSMIRVRVNFEAFD